DDAYHAVRIRLKHARYAIEAVARALDPAGADDARKLARRLADLQDLLGGLQDAAVAAEALEAAVAEHPVDATLAFAAGRLAERQLAHVRTAREAFGPRWAKARKRRRLRWSAV
ncbi:MAG: CHAD domain-containing protein, partial [Candidatus Limnocylindria bacterium]